MSLSQTVNGQGNKQARTTQQNTKFNSTQTRQFQNFVGTENKVKTFKLHYLRCWMKDG